MKITLVEINGDNWEACAKLQVAESQVPYLPSNAYTVAESKFNAQIKLLGILLDQKMIGFAAYVLDDDDDMNLYRYMIDKLYQGQGYGSKALDLLMSQIKKETMKDEIWLSLHPDNEAAIKMYENYGFRQTTTGFEETDEMFFCYKIGEASSPPCSFAN